MRNKVVTVIVWSLLLASLAAVYISVVDGKLSRHDNFYNADALYIPAVYQDLASGYGLLGWNPPAVPYFFPDMPIYFLIKFLVGNFHLSLILYGVVQFLLLIIGIILISNQVFGSRPNIHFLIQIAGIMMGLLFVMAAGNFPALMPMFVSGYHFGAFLSAIFSIFLITRLLRSGSDFSGRSIVLYSALFLIASLTIASDALYLVQFLIPALIGFWLLLLTAKISLRQLFYFYIILVPAAPLGYWLNRALLIYRPVRPPNRLSLAIVVDNFIRAKHELIATWTQGAWFPEAWVPLFTIIWIVFVALTIIVIIRFFYNSMGRISTTLRSPKSILNVIIFTVGLFGTLLPILAFKHRLIFWGTFVLTSTYLWSVSRIRDVQKTTENSNKLYLLSFFITMVVASIGSFLVLGVLSQSRYFLPALLIPIFFGWPFLMASSKRFMKLWDRIGIQIGVILVLIILLFQFGSLAHASRLSKLSDFYPDYIKRLDGYAEKNKIFNGIAQYDLARPITMLSKKNLLIVQAKPDLSIDHWINNLNTYNNRFDFFISDTRVGKALQINAQLVEAKFGKPANTYSSRDFKVLVYNRPQDIAFQRQFQQMFVFYFDGAQLSSETGHIIGSARIADSGSSAKGCLAKSPKLDLWIGDYQFRIAYFAAHENDTVVGTWDVILTTEENQRIVLKKGKINPDGLGIISGVASIRKPGIIEIRMFYQGKGTLQINSLRIKRLR